ncbi:hypothetical protein GWI33_006109 [Rhynchophorus ferrugineus]|uniref:Uncharacterized protein n=1 Tax=Rhynchophorus ferrugineus TaxID=354439 RepID=A0A834ME18_RHYFE|nr:hypothetical protein GWI33_006109 [Rhynchophorus ferrugineus]
MRPNLITTGPKSRPESVSPGSQKINKETGPHQLPPKINNESGEIEREAERERGRALARETHARDKDATGQNKLQERETGYRKEQDGLLHPLTVTGATVRARDVTTCVPLTDRVRNVLKIEESDANLI